MITNARMGEEVLRMFIVYMYWVVDRTKTLCVVTETREKAEEYVQSKMEGRRYSGAGVYKIDEIPLYS